jgi:hypothetical protein
MFLDMTDLEPKDGGCTHLSAAFGFEATSAYVVRYPDDTLR